MPHPFQTGFLPEKDGHKVYFARYGKTDGQAVIVLHGGPGGQSKPKQASTYDLTRYQVITFDQRGCGKSLPLGRTQSNTTQDLVADIERLREHLGLESWFVAGGSWGSTLALVYAETHPERVKGLLLGSIFLARQADDDWAFSANQGVQRLFPDLWEERLQFLKQFHTEPAQAASALLALLEEASDEVVKQIVAGVSNWEGNLMSAQSDLTWTEPEEVTDDDIASVKVFLHYEAHHYFLEPDQILQHTSAIEHLPTILIHGRYDVLCPLEQMWELQQRLHHVETVILPTSNHKLTADGDVAKKYAFRGFLEQQSRNQANP